MTTWGEQLASACDSNRGKLFCLSDLAAHIEGAIGAMIDWLCDPPLATFASVTSQRLPGLGAVKAKRLLPELDGLTRPLELDRKGRDIGTRAVGNE